MRIHYLSSSYLPSRAANSLHVIKMCGALARAGHEVMLHAMAAGSETDADIFSYYGAAQSFGLRLYPWSQFPAAVRLAALQAGWAARNADLVLARNLLAAPVACMLGAPVIYEAHIPVSQNPLARRVFAWMIDQPNFLRLVVITHSLKAWFVENYPSLAEKIVVLPDAADPVPPHVPPYEFPSALERLQVGYVGHLYDGKGMEVISALPALCPWADFSIVGGMDADVQRWRQAVGQFPNIRFFGHRLHGETLAFLAAFDVVLLPNQRIVRAAQVGKQGGQPLDIGEWTSPLKMFEYMAAGKAIVASDLPVLREVLRDNDNALLCPPDRPDIWAEKLAALNQDVSLRKRLAASALSDFERSYSWDKRAGLLLDAVQRL